MNEFSGEIVAEFIEVRFAYSGKIGEVYKRIGQKVKKLETIARLDKQLLQVELDKELASYEKARAEFEVFSVKHGKGPDSDDIVKYQRVKQQADLDGAVKNIESAKFRMDQSVMISPVNGIIIDLHGLSPGIYITPASNPVTVIDIESMTFVIEVPQEEIFQFKEERKMRVYIPGIEDTVIGTQRLPTHGKKGQFRIPIELSYHPSVFPGMTGNATFKLD